MIYVWIVKHMSGDITITTSKREEYRPKMFTGETYYCLYTTGSNVEAAIDKTIECNLRDGYTDVPYDDFPHLISRV